MADPMLIARAHDKDAFKDICLLPNIGVPVFVADIKGDLSGIGAAGNQSDKLMQRLAAIGITEYTPRANTVVFWDVFGEQGHPVRATISDMGPLLIARLLNLNDTQTGVLTLVFRVADDNGMLLLDLKDLRAMVQYVGENAKSFTTEYGTRRPSPPSTATSPPPRSAPSSATCWRSKSRAATCSSASRCSTSTTSCRPTPTVAA